MIDKTFLKTVIDKLSKLVTYYVSIFIVSLCIGTYFGFKIASHVFEKKMDEAIMLGGIVYKGKVYDVKERVMKP